jgi:hypothetical protein
MSKSAHDTIDRVYDAAERSVDGLAAVLGVDTRDEQPASQPTRSSLPAAKPQLALAPVAERVKFRIAPSQDVATQARTFVITDGTTFYTTPDEAFARAVLAELAKVGAA